jgi:MOSC domain-containing protein YiiM
MQPVKIVSVNVGQPQDIRLGKHHSLSGIDKKAVPGSVQVGELGLEGDHILSKKHHGGPDQAVYLYSLEDYDAFAEALGDVPLPGSFGENLTISGLESASVLVGTRLTIGEGAGSVVLEVTAPRIPCATFAAHMGDAGFVRTFRQMRRPGIYTRVLQAGPVKAGDTGSAEQGAETAPTLGEQFELHYDPNPSRSDLERFLAAPVAVRFRAEYLERLAKLLV